MRITRMSWLLTALATAAVAVPGADAAGGPRSPELHALGAPLEPVEEARLDLVLEEKAAASPAPPELRTFATQVARRAVRVSCPSDAEWRWHLNLVGRVLGYAWSGRTIVAWLAPNACRGARAVSRGNTKYSERKRAMGVLVLVHEALHLRSWRHADDEAAVECAAIRRFKRSVIQLGGTQEEAQRLWPWALALHWWLVRRHDEYWRRSCPVLWY